jgi:transposase InsO family protein
VLALRDEHPYWGARKLRRVLINRGHSLPAISTVHAILERHGRIPPEAGEICRPMQRFEREHPNELWQMDFKGDFALSGGGRCYPLTIIDDHSRFSVCVGACANQRRGTVQDQLTGVFERYGLPEAVLADHGAPWGDDRDSPHTRLTIWMLRLGIRIRHGRPYHPQTQGKEERFNRTLKDEVLRGRAPLVDLAQAQKVFDVFRHRYNTERPHQALDDELPISRYRPSERHMPSQLPELIYPEEAIIRRVNNAYINWRGQRWRVGKPFEGETLGLKPGEQDGHWSIYFGHHLIAHLDETKHRLTRVLK